jgi:hypothetical protein
MVDAPILIRLRIVLGGDCQIVNRAAGACDEPTGFRFGNARFLRLSALQEPARPKRAGKTEQA